MNTNTLSIVIPTLGRDQEPLSTANALLPQMKKNDELIIVDQNTPPLPELRALSARDSRLKHIYSDTTGYSFNLNVGIAHATGDILLFLDDDIIPNSEIVEKHRDHYSEAPEAFSGVAGRVLQPQGDLPPDEITQVGKFNTLTGHVVGNFNAQSATQTDVAPGGNMSVLRSRLLEVGGFDEQFDGNGYRCETDLCLRINRLSKTKFIFEPKAEIIHLMAPRGGCRLPDKAEHTFYFVKNGMILFRRHGRLFALPFCLGYFWGYAALKALYNRNLSIFFRGQVALALGMKATMAIRQSQPSLGRI